MADETLSQNVFELQKDMAQVATLVDRIDVTIEKLTEVSTTVSQLLAVQGNRLEMQEKLQEKLQDVVEKRKSEMDDAINKVYLRIERIESKLQDDMEENQTSILDEIKEMREESKSQHLAFNSRMNKIERWMWTVAGGFGVVVLILSIIDPILSVVAS